MINFFIGGYPNFDPSDSNTSYMELRAVLFTNGNWGVFDVNDPSGTQLFQAFQHAPRLYPSHAYHNFFLNANGY